MGFEGTRGRGVFFTNRAIVALPFRPVSAGFGPRLGKVAMEPPYGVIGGLLKKRRVVPFLGAGASFVGRPPPVRLDPNAPTFLPSGLDLAHLLADEAEFPSNDEHDRNDLARVASYFASVAGRRILRDRLREVLLASSGNFGELHQFLSQVPGPLVIVVTNYDTLPHPSFP